MPNNIINKIFGVILLSTYLTSAQPIEKTSPLFNIGLGFGGMGLTYRDSVNERKHLNYLHFKPFIGYYITPKLEAGPVFEYLRGRTNIEGYSNGDGYGFGAYARYNFTGFNPVKFIFSKTRIRSFFYVQTESLYSTISYQDPTQPTFDDNLNNWAILPQVGLKIGLYKQLFITLGCTYHFMNGFQPTLPSPVQSTFALEYVLVKKTKKDGK